jgi:hemolysin activation/secretion protein
MQAGKSWGNVISGHQTYRIGGNVVEGYFTRRPTRLFPLRGFNSNVLDASKAVTGGVEVFWPLLNLQKGYKTVPLFFHRFRLGTFIDAGAASESLSWDDTLMGAGIELVTSFEFAWGYLSDFRIGIAWPIRQPDILDERGTIFLIQIGRPL